MCRTARRAGNVLRRARAPPPPAPGSRSPHVARRGANFSHPLPSTPCTVENYFSFSSFFRTSLVGKTLCHLDFRNPSGVFRVSHKNGPRKRHRHSWPPCSFSRRPSARAALPADTVALVEHTGYRSVNDKTRLCPAVTTRASSALACIFVRSECRVCPFGSTGFSPFSPPELAGI